MPVSWHVSAPHATPEPVDDFPLLGVAVLAVIAVLDLVGLLVVIHR
jgi:hypothetical protein